MYGIVCMMYVQYTSLKTDDTNLKCHVKHAYECEVSKFRSPRNDDITISNILTNTENLLRC